MSGWPINAELTIFLLFIPFFYFPFPSLLSVPRLLPTLHHILPLFSLPSLLLPSVFLLPPLYPGLSSSHTPPSSRVDAS